jgi:fructokinase
MPAILVLGEALIDLIDTGGSPYQAHLGGSPFNVAIGAARLGIHTKLLARFSTDPFGMLLRQHATESNVDLSLSVLADAPSTIALVQLQDGVARYRFSVDGTVDFSWTDAELATVSIDRQIVHFGSLSSWLAPGRDPIHRFITHLHDRGDVLVTYDPNLRPALQPERERTSNQVDSALRNSHLVKASAEDLAWLYPGVPFADVASQWLQMGPSLVIFTLAGEGSVAYCAGGHPVARPIQAGPVVDTIGAGDAFMSGLLGGLYRRGIRSPSEIQNVASAADTLADLLDEAATVAALTCARAGANPPWLSEVDFDRNASRQRVSSGRLQHLGPAERRGGR